MPQSATSRSWGSMARTCRAPILVLLLGGLGLTVPPQARDMLSFDSEQVWPWVAFQGQKTTMAQLPQRARSRARVDSELLGQSPSRRARHQPAVLDHGVQGHVLYPPAG